MKKNLRSKNRLSADTFAPITKEHVDQAIADLLGGEVEHPFGPSTGYDVVMDDGRCLPPKAVFGIAATKALGFEVLPENFSGGLNTTCFRKLEEHGLTIRVKSDYKKHNYLLGCGLNLPSI